MNNDIKILIKLFCFQEEIIQKNIINYTSNNDDKSQNGVFLIRKESITKYKNYFNYDTLYKFLKEKTNILEKIKENGIIKYQKLDDSIISNVYPKIPKNYIKKIEKTDKKKLSEQILKEKEWNNKYIKYNISNIQAFEVKLIDDFEIINNELLQLFLTEQNIKFKNLFGNIIFIEKKMFISINIYQSRYIYEIGHFDEKNKFHLEYLLDQDDINDVNVFIEYLLKLGMNKLIILIDENQIININDTKIKCYKVDKNPIKEKDEDIKQTNDNLFQIFYDDKLKVLILLLIYEYNNNLEEVYLINKKYLDAFYLEEINKLINKNDNIKTIAKDNHDYTLEFADEIIKNLDYNSLDKINKLFSKIKLNKIECKVAKEKINFNKSKKNIYKEFFLVSKKIYNYLQQYFKIQLKDLHISFISINNKDILIDNDQFIIFIGNLDKKKYSYNIDLILDFKTKNDFNEELKVLINIGYIKYFIKKLLFNEGISNDYIFPIFTNDKVIGYAYKYNSTTKDYSKFKLIDYNSYLKKGVLKNIILLFSYYKQLKYKNNKISKEYYLINKEFMNNIKKEYEYDKVYKQLEVFSAQIENYKNESIYTFIKLLPEDLLTEFSNKKINKKIYDENMNYSIEPLFISINYYDYDKKENSSLYIYNNFEIIEKEIFDLFVDKRKNENNILVNFSNNKIIVNIPFNLNNKFVSLIGTFTNYNDNFNLEYILVYNKEIDRNNHFNNITFNLENYLNSLNLSNNSCPITLENNSIIGTIIKYINNDKKENKETNYNKDNKNIMKLKHKFESCPNIGLQNIGATCYMNSTLQCFCHIEKFVEFFKYNPEIFEIIKNKKNKLSYSFKILISNLWPNDYDPSSPGFKKYYSPEEFKNTISKMNPLFEGIAANDAKDLINFIIMFLHLELNKNIEKKANQINGIIDQTNKELVFQAFKEEVIKNNNSIISELFYATNYNITQCCNCNKCIYNFQTYFFINFPLEEVRKYKIENINQQQNNFNMYNSQNQFNCFMMNPQIQFNNYNMFPQNQFMMNQQIQINNNINEVNIIDCFDYNEKLNYMSGENKMYCNYCRFNSDCFLKTNLYTGPEILILILNRGKGIEFDVKIYFTEELNLSKFIENKESGYMYNLIGVITHLGESSMSGHFIAYCKDPINGKWYKYNDAIVDEVKDFKKEVIDFAMPYLLFYQKKSN